MSRPMEDLLEAIANPNRELLIKNLKNLLPILEKMPQITGSSQKTASSRKSNDMLVTVAQNQGLMSKTLVEHKSKDVRILTACCVSQVLRIFAPNPPYTPKQLEKVFAMFFRELRGLKENVSPYLPYYLYLLESLALVQTPSLLVTKFPNNDALVIKLFRVLFDLCGQVDNSSRIEAHFIQILSVCLNEMSHISTTLVDVILETLIVENVVSNPLAADIVRKLFSRSEDALERPIGNFILDNILCLDEENMTGNILEKSDQLEILYEIATSRPTLLVSVLSQVEDIMEIQNGDLRADFVGTIGKIFTTVHGVLGGQKIYDRLFTSFIKRFNDVSDPIRQMVCRLSSDILITQSRFRDNILECLEQRLLDASVQVRSAAVQSICIAAAKDPECMNSNVLQSLGERCRDKDSEIQEHALTGLASLFSNHCAEFWKNGQPLPKSSKKYSTVPRKIFSIVLLKPSTVPIVEKIAYSTLLGGDKFTSDEKVRCFTGVLCSLDSEAKKGLDAILKFKSIWRTRLMNFLAMNQQISRVDSKTKEIEYNTLLKKQIMMSHNIITQLRQGELIGNEITITNEEGAKALIDMVRCKDKNMLKYLSILCSNNGTARDMKTSVNEIKRIMRTTKNLFSGNAHHNVKKASKQEQVCMKLITTVLLHMVNVESVPLFCKQIDSNLSKNRFQLCEGSLDFLASVGLHMPHMLSSSVQSFCNYLSYTEKDGIFENALLCLSRLPSNLNEKYVDKKVINTLTNTMKTLVITNPVLPYYSKLIIRSYASVCSQSKLVSVSNGLQTLLSKAMENIIKNFNDDTDITQVACVFKAISETLRRCPEALLSYDIFNDIINFIQYDLMKKIVDEWRLDVLLPAIQTGIKVLVEYIIALSKQNNQTQSSSEIFTYSILQLLLVLIRSEGTLVYDSEDKINGENKLLYEGVLLSAGKGLLKLCRVSKPILNMMTSPESPLLKDNNQHDIVLPISTFIKNRPVPYFIAWVGMVLHSDSSDVRLAVMNYLVKQLNLRLSFPVFGVLLSYAASFPKEDKTRIFNSLQYGINNDRQKYAYAKRLLLNKDKNKNSQVVLRVPEFALADLIYVLSKHDDFVDIDEHGNPEPEENMLEVYNFFQQFLEFFLTALLPKHSQTNNYGLVLQITNEIKGRKDTRDGNNKRIYQLAEMAHLIAKQQWEGRPWADSTNQVVLSHNLYANLDTKHAHISRRTMYLPKSYTNKFTLNTDQNNLINIIQDNASTSTTSKKKKSSKKTSVKKAKKEKKITKKKKKIMKKEEPIIERKLPSRHAKSNANISISKIIENSDDSDDTIMIDDDESDISSSGEVSFVESSDDDNNEEMEEKHITIDDDNMRDESEESEEEIEKRKKKSTPVKRKLVEAPTSKNTGSGRKTKQTKITNVVTMPSGSFRRSKRL